MWCFSKRGLTSGLLSLLALGGLLTLSGCMSDTPTETDMPWAAPASWEGTMPLPSGMINRYE